MFGLPILIVMLVLLFITGQMDNLAAEIGRLPSSIWHLVGGVPLVIIIGVCLAVFAAIVLQKPRFR